MSRGILRRARKGIVGEGTLRTSVLDIVKKWAMTGEWCIGRSKGTEFDLPVQEDQTQSLRGG